MRLHHLNSIRYFLVGGKYEGDAHVPCEFNVALSTRIQLVSAKKAARSFSLVDNSCTRLQLIHEN